MSDERELTPEERHVALVHLPRRRSTDRPPAAGAFRADDPHDPENWLDLVTPLPGKRGRSYKERCAMAEARLQGKLLRALDESPDPLHPAWQHAYFRLAEAAHGKPAVVAEVRGQFLIEVDILDE